MQSGNNIILAAAARMLVPLLDQLVFVGGCATALLITDPGATEVRSTFDVDAIVEISTYGEYQRFSEKLRDLGFSEDVDAGAPICRWKCGSIQLDVIPSDESILGFSSRWYKSALHAAERRDIEPGLEVLVISAPYFIATKLEAFKQRGRRDFLASHDLEDLLAVVDGRVELVDELQASPQDVRRYVSEQVIALLAEPRFHDALPGHLAPDPASQARVAILLERLKRMVVPE